MLHERNEVWSKVRVHPWVGVDYEKPAIFPYRTLILGESNYTTPDNFGTDLVISCVGDDILGSDPNFCRFSTKIRRVIFGRNTEIGPEEFWRNAAFYNFVQYLVGGKSKERPTSQMWIDSAEPFSEVVAKLKPERILVLGKGNWGNLLAHIEHEKVDEMQANLLVDGYSALAGYICHPSAGRGFSYQKWQPLAESIVLKHNPAVKSCAVQ